MEEVIELLKEKGYTEEEGKEIVSNYALVNMKPGTLKRKIEENNNFLLSLGYSEAEVIKMTKSSPSIYSLSIDSMKKKIEDMKELGYSEAEVIKMTKSLPAIYSYSIDSMKEKIEDMKELGYSEAEVIKMTKSLPQIFGLSVENMKQKIEYYNSIGLHNLPVIDTKQLMQSVQLSYARYMFYKERGITIDETNYKRLFISQKQFERQYGKTKEELLAKYDYAKYLESQGTKNTQELGKETSSIQGETEYLDATEKDINAAMQEKHKLEKEPQPEENE